MWFENDNSMKTYIALFRGINVGGHHVLPMRELVSLLERLGAEQIKTYIQSGNAVFRHRDKHAAKLADGITAVIKKSRGFAPQVLLLDSADWEKVMALNPFPEATSDPKHLHLFFLASVPKSPDLDALADIRQDGERFHLGRRVFYLHAPNGMGRSKLAARVEPALGVSATARNWRTVDKVMALARQIVDAG